MQPGRCLAVTLLALSILDIKTTSTFSKTTRVLKVVRLPAGYMEVVKEDTCSDGVIRLTCRSLHAFIFVLEAEYQRDKTHSCHQVNKVRRAARFREFRSRMHENAKIQLRGNYIKDDEGDDSVIDLRTLFNRRCSGLYHCRVTITEDHPGASKWQPANLRLKYACIPENAVRRYCNMEVTINDNEGGYVKSPGYPLYYPGKYSCGWTFHTVPGQRVSLIFHDFNIRSPEPNGRCLDTVRVRENGKILFESCGTRAGMKIISNSNKITVDLISSSRVYPARGFLLQYGAIIGCPEAQAPNGSYVTNDTLDSRTYKCRSGTIFPDTNEPTRTLDCRNGRWNETIDSLPTCVASSAVILKTEADSNRLSSLSDNNFQSTGVRIGRTENAVAGGNIFAMADPVNTAMAKQTDVVRDMVIPSILIVLLFVGNAVIVYIIFQYRKRKTPAVNSGEGMALRAAQDVPQV
ncbi:uncharacterized protein LOC103577137 [Microplitis demolitor]|uniref:uncharacterized protein LOC103577137 n=1 Tax=Microplitis demolitor TaxID=69319 RepID=UPI0006D4C8E6|nr:uncharacterized protein LOC103577137 [Microplitis demolitor]